MKASNAIHVHRTKKAIQAPLRLAFFFSSLVVSDGTSVDMNIMNEIIQQNIVK